MPALEGTPVLVVGAGIMGGGIAQVAAQAGHPVMLYDSQPDAAENSLSRLESTFEKLVAKGKFSEPDATEILARIEPLASLEQAANAGLVIEAIVEDVEAKRELMQRLESIVDDACVLATNTSSISINAIANGLKHPGRCLGLHFFNPVPLMKLVEVISGMQTSPDIANAVTDLSSSWNKVPVRASSTPGFIVNRIARPFYAETLALLQEQAATAPVLDACLRSAGFRMGPCELMDLIGQDTNFAVTRSVYEANFYDKRYMPSQIQKSMVDAGQLGRKSGHGFYDYAEAAKLADPDYSRPQYLPPHGEVCVHGSGELANHIAGVLEERECQYQRIEESDWCGLQVDQAQLRLTDGRPASLLGPEVAVFDWPLVTDCGGSLAWSPSVNADPQWIADATIWIGVLGFQPRCTADTPGLVVARTIAMLINEAADAVQQGVCNEADADTAMKLGVNYPAGPFEWLASWNASSVISVLESLDDYYRGERYRISPRLRRQSWRKT